MPIETNDKLRIQVIGSGEIPMLLSQHPELIMDMLYPNFFATPAWFNAVIRTTSSSNVFGLLASRAGSPVALLPLETVRNRLGGTDYRYLGYRFHPDPLGLICSKNELAAVVSALSIYLANLTDWDRLILDYLLPEESALWTGDVRLLTVAPYFSLPSDFETLIGGFNGKKRYKLRAKIRRAEEAGLKMRIADTVDDKTDYLEALFRIHELRSKDVGRISSLQKSEVERLHMDLVQTSPETHLFALFDENKIVAVIYGFLSHDRFSFFQITHDPAYDELRPGTVILAKTLAFLCEAGAIEFNFLQGDEEYKFEWTSSTRQLMRLQLDSKGIRPCMLAYGEKLKKIIRRTVPS